MKHLGALVTPYVDGELSPGRAAEARAHLDCCAECSRAVELEQLARRRTQESTLALQARPELTARLLAMPAGSLPAPEPVRPRRAPLVLGGGAALVGLFVLTLFVLGAPRPVTTPSAVLDAARVDAGAPTTVPAAMAAPEVGELATWALPTDASVGALAILDDGATQTLDLVVTTAAGEARILERSGTLDEAAAAWARSEVVSGRTVYEVDGWYVLESGPCVVAVHGETEAAAEAVIAALPEAAPDGLLGRLLTGWTALVG